MGTSHQLVPMQTSWRVLLLNIRMREQDFLHKSFSFFIFLFISLSSCCLFFSSPCLPIIFPRSSICCCSFSHLPLLLLSPLPSAGLGNFTSARSICTHPCVCQCLYFHCTTIGCACWHHVHAPHCPHVLLLHYSTIKCENLKTSEK